MTSTNWTDLSTDAKVLTTALRPPHVSQNSLIKLTNLSSTLLYLTIVMYCITSCQLSKANDTNCGPRTRSFTLTRKSSSYDNCNFITRLLFSDANWLLRTLFYSLTVFNYTSALYCLMRCVIFALNQYDDDENDSHTAQRSLCRLHIFYSRWNRYHSILHHILDTPADWWRVKWSDE